LIDCLNILGIFTPPEIPVYSHSSSSSEKISKFSSQTSTQQGSVPFPNLPVNESPAFVAPAPAPAPKVVAQPPPVQQQPRSPAFAPQQAKSPAFVQQQARSPAFVQQQARSPAFVQQHQQDQYHHQQQHTQQQQYQETSKVVEHQTTFMQKSTTQQQQQKTIQNSVPQSFPPKSPVQFNQTLPGQAKYQPAPTGGVCSKNSAPPKQRAGLNASPVTPGILKKQIQVDAAVPRMLSSPSVNTGKKSPVPIFNTTPTPFGYPGGLGIQTPDTVAHLAPISPAPLAPSPIPKTGTGALKPLPVIVNTPIPKFTSNYNLAASGWGVPTNRDYYKSIQMQGGKKLIPPTVYTDF
jgi:hypothetical protein